MEWGGVSPLIIGQLTIMGFVWGFAIWLSRSFTKVYEKIQKSLDMMITKLEYHEEHDDKRFSQITDGLWAIKVESAVSKALENKTENK